jgi:hypothetical protein
MIWGKVVCSLHADGKKDFHRLTINKYEPEEWRKEPSLSFLRDENTGRILAEESSPVLGESYQTLEEAYLDWCGFLR